MGGLGCGVPKLVIGAAPTPPPQLPELGQTWPGLPLLALSSENLRPAQVWAVIDRGVKTISYEGGVSLSLRWDEGNEPSWSTLMVKHPQDK